MGELSERNLTDSSMQRERQPVPKMNILAVDDEPNLPIVFGRMAQCSKMAYAIGLFKVVSSGQEAVREVLEEPGRYNVVLTDLQMPEMDGLRVADALKDQEGVFVYVVSGAVDSIDQNKLKTEHGVRGFLKKPYSLEEVGNFLNDAYRDLDIKEGKI